MDIATKLTSVTDDLDVISGIICPEMRPAVYYLVTLFDQDGKIILNNLERAISQVPGDWAAFIAASKDLEVYAETANAVIEDTIKRVLEGDSHGLRDLAEDMIDVYNQNITDKKSVPWTNAIYKLACNLIASPLFSKQRDFFLQKCVLSSLFYSLMTIQFLVNSKIVKVSWSQEDILKYCIAHWVSLLYYHTEKRHINEWLPTITNIFAQNGGRRFRLQRVKLASSYETVELYKTVFPDFTLSMAILPDWHNSLYHSIIAHEEKNGYKGLYKVFRFHIIDEFIRLSCAFKENLNEALLNIHWFPTKETLRRYFCLYTGNLLYGGNDSDAINITDKRIFKFILDSHNNYEDCLEELRKEYFPEDMYDMNALLNNAAEFYDDKLHMDYTLGYVSKLNELDNNSIWYTSEWIIQNRNYPFLKKINAGNLASMIGNHITHS